MLLENLDKIHTTELGAQRIKTNLEIQTDPVAYCVDKIIQYKNSIIKTGKNYYVASDREIITVNANSYTIITAHKIKT